MKGGRADEEVWRESLTTRQRRLEDFDSKLAHLNSPDARVWQDFIWGVFAHMVFAVAAIAGAAIVFALWVFSRR